jgi:hypothetical protein
VDRWPVDDWPVDDEPDSSGGGAWDPAGKGRRAAPIVLAVVLVVVLVFIVGVCLLAVLAGAGAWVYSRNG